LPARSGRTEEIPSVAGDVIQFAETTDPSRDQSGRTDAGSAYVIYGKSDTTRVDLANLSSAGYRVDGANGNKITNAASIGDVNADNRDEVLLGEKNSYVLFGRPASAPIDLAARGDIASRCRRSNVVRRRRQP